MEASRDQLAENSDDAGTTVAVLTADAGLAAVNAAVASAPGTLAMASYVDAADFAGLVEDLSRTVDYLQILAAGAVDRTRTQAITAAATTRTTRSWTTGWDNGAETLNETDTGWPAGTTAGTTSWPIPRSPADDGCKNTAEFLRLRIRIGRSEATRRIHLAAALTPKRHEQPAHHRVPRDLVQPRGPVHHAREVDHLPVHLRRQSIRRQAGI